MGDPTRPPPVLPLCSHGHVACIVATDPDGDEWCWGYHLVFEDPDWPARVLELFPDTVARLAALLVEHGVNVTSCAYEGRGLD